MATGPKRDLTLEISNAIKNTSMKLGLYHSMFEWFNPLYVADKNSGYRTNKFVREKTMPELYELVNKYEPSLIWSDGADNARSTDYWNATSFLSWLYNDSPVKSDIVVNDRWGNDTMCKHGGFLTCNDNYSPGKLVVSFFLKIDTMRVRIYSFRSGYNVALNYSN